MISPGEARLQFVQPVDSNVCLRTDELTDPSIFKYIKEITAMTLLLQITHSPSYILLCWPVSYYQLVRKGQECIKFDNNYSLVIYSFSRNVIWSSAEIHSRSRLRIKDGYFALIGNTMNYLIDSFNQYHYYQYRFFINHIFRTYYWKALSCSLRNKKLPMAKKSLLVYMYIIIKRGIKIWINIGPSAKHNSSELYNVLDVLNSYFSSYIVMPINTCCYRSNTSNHNVVTAFEFPRHRWIAGTYGQKAKYFVRNERIFENISNTGSESTIDPDTSIF
ncbi:hypothetical protein BDC45DRAFT_534561 [Circinella umbellata]|nr:hypothetical protein BDC45DRAFT_534561 [Circinella umbellata]